MPPRPLATLSALALAALAGCGPSLPAGSASCGPERTELDGVCVSQTVADYVSCVRAQGARLGSDRSRRLSAEAGHLGVRVGGTAELRDTLEKQYSVSSASELEIIHECGRLAGTQGATLAAAPSAAPAATSPAGVTGGPPPAPAATGPGGPPAPAAASAPPDLARGLLARWKLDEGSGSIAHDAVGGLNLTLSPGYWSPGRLGGAVRVGGGDHVLTSAPQRGPHSPRELTLALWIYQDAPGLGVLVFKGSQPDHDDSRNREYSLFVREDGRLEFGYVARAVAGKHGYYLRTGAAVVRPERWTHVAATLSQETRLAVLHVDGSEVVRFPDFDPTGSDIRPIDGPLWLGNGFSGRAGFEGVLDDVRIYGRVLSPAELGALARGEQ